MYLNKYSICYMGTKYQEYVYGGYIWMTVNYE